MRYKEIYVMKIKVQRAYDAGPVFCNEVSARIIMTEETARRRLILSDMTTPMTGIS